MSIGDPRKAIRVGVGLYKNLLDTLGLLYISTPGQTAPYPDIAFNILTFEQCFLLWIEDMQNNDPDRLLLFCTKTATITSNFILDLRPSVVKLAKQEAVVLGHFDGVAASLDLRRTFPVIRYFEAHSRPILCVDLNIVSLHNLNGLNVLNHQQENIKVYS